MVGGINSADIHMINTIAMNGGGISDNLSKTPFFQHDPQGILGIFVEVKIEIPTYDSWFCIGAHQTPFLEVAANQQANCTC